MQSFISCCNLLLIDWSDVSIWFLSPVQATAVKTELKLPIKHYSDNHRQSTSSSERTNRELFSQEFNEAVSLPWWNHVEGESSAENTLTIGDLAGQDNCLQLPYREAYRSVERYPAKVCICDICGKRSYSVSDLQRHRRIHTGEKPFACNLCPYTSAERSNLNRHKKNVHKEVFDY